MFTGIVEGTGKVVEFKDSRQGALLRVQTVLPFKGIKLGESIAVDGCCLTVTRFQKKILSFDVSDETLRKTTMGDYKTGRVVNLERALRAGDRLGGHFVSGHVDTVGRIHRLKRHTHSLEMVVEYPTSFAATLIDKGSVTVDGMSLTVCDPKKNRFHVYIIPHTEQVTSLTDKKEGDAVNLEMDLLGKYVERLISLRQK